MSKKTVTKKSQAVSETSARTRRQQASSRLPDLCLPHLFEKQVAETPQAVALTMPGDGDREAVQLTYAELNRRANQVGRCLKSLGVGPEVPVALCLERSPELVIGILGILKAGGAYVPLELAYPKSRLALILADSQAPVLLTQSHLLAKLPSHQARVVCLDTDRDKIDRESSANLPRTTVPRNLAYIIYTSGSTGQPKGVLISHRNVTRLFQATEAWYNFNRDDVWVLFHSYAFDVSVWEMWGALLYGGRLVIISYQVSRSPEIFCDLLCAEQVTVLNQTPSAFRQLVRAEQTVGAFENLALRYVVFAGEALDLNSLRPWIERHGDQQPRLINMYGITETTVHVTYRPITRADLANPGSSPIGRPIPDLQLHLLDQQLRPVASGHTGEIYVGGPGLARGYLNRPELTRQRFIPNPFDDTPGARLYKSGDLARRLPNGDLEYLGRIDAQVKIRGFRIEPGEIETALTQHPAISEAAVVAREETPGQNYLAAYLVFSSRSPTPAIEEIRRFLADRLPDYMIPAAFTPLKQIPLTPNGKTDRRALPLPRQDRSGLQTAYAPPRSTLEQMLADLWQEILGLRQVGRNDDFFALGGDSLLAAKLINNLQDRLKEYLYVVALFDAPTVAQLAAYLQTNYSHCLAALTGSQTDQSGLQDAAPPRPSTIEAAQVQQMRRIIAASRPQTTAEPAADPKNPAAIFILTAPRSGSTLFRVMLAGHAALFAPPELELLSFDTLRQRNTTLSAGDQFRQSGLVRAIMALKACPAEQAYKLIQDFQAQNLTTQQIYRHLQAWSHPKTLVDKTTFYALDINTLHRAERYFDQPLYLHLQRHPHGAIHSFEKARLDRIFFKDQQDFSPQEVAELTWLICHQNILDFLETIPARRQLALQFETLVRTPEAAMKQVCQFLDIPFHPATLRPYEAPAERMTDGIYPQSESKMLGDIKFHQHRSIDAQAADAWQQTHRPHVLGDAARQLARQLGYQLEPPAAETAARPARIQPARRQQPTVSLDQLSDDDIDRLLQQHLNQ